MGLYLTDEGVLAWENNAKSPDEIDHPLIGTKAVVVKDDDTKKVTKKAVSHK